MNDMKIRGEDGPVQHFLSVVKSLTQKLKGDHLKKCIDAKEAGSQQKARDDMQVLKEMPAVSRLQKGFAMGT